MFQCSVALCSLPAAIQLSHIPSFGATVTPFSGVTPTTLAWSVASEAGMGNPLATQLAALLQGMSQQQVTTDRVTYWDWLANHPQEAA